MIDLVEALRAEARMDGARWEGCSELMIEAADALEALRVDVEAWKASHFMLTDTCHHFQARAERLAGALREIEAIEDEMEGGDWDEIEAARKIATAALHPTTTQEEGK